MKKTLIVLTGWARDKHSYQKLIQSARKGWKVLIPTYRELGLQKGVLEFEKNLLSFVKSQKSPVSLLGHSLGGALAIGFASKHQKHIKELFLVDSKGVTEGNLLKGVGDLLGENRKRTILEHMQHLKRILKRPIFHVKSGIMAHYADLEKEAMSIKAKTTLFWGEKDLLTPLSHGKKIKEYIQNSRLVVFENFSHDWILNFPERFWKEIES